MIRGSIFSQKRINNVWNSLPTNIVNVCTVNEFKNKYIVSQKRSHYYFLNNSVKNKLILIIFGKLNPEGTSH